MELTVISKSRVVYPERHRNMRIIPDRNGVKGVLELDLLDDCVCPLLQYKKCI